MLKISKNIFLAGEEEEQEEEEEEEEEEQEEEEEEELSLPMALFCSVFHPCIASLR